MNYMNYMNLQGDLSDYSKSEIVLVPVPFDGTSTWIKGADKGPKAMLEASEKVELYDIETRSSIYKKGIHTMQPICTGNEKSEEVADIVQC